MTPEHAAEFAREWIASWNAHDLDRILSHYTDDFEMSSPFIVRIMNEPSGTLTGKERIRAYWQAALARNPGLHFTLIAVHTGANSVSIHYTHQTGLQVTEVFFLNEHGLVYRAAAHYLAL